MINPALVSQRAVQRLPRSALLLFCLAYVVPGLFGRDPWKNADITAVGYMLSMAQGESSWWHPTLAGVANDASVLPYWIGAVFILTGDGWMSPALAARLPFALLLLGTLTLAWRACFHFARSDEAQPLAFAFGGEARPSDYARTLADGAVLALMASLGLLQLGHETTPELVQLFAATLFLYGLSVLAHRPERARVTLVLALLMLGASGAATTAVVLCAVAMLLVGLSAGENRTVDLTWLLGGGLLAAAVATALHAWVWKLGTPPQSLGLLKLLAWFCWPTWPMAAWTLWTWRRHWTRRHIAYPLGLLGATLVISAAMGGSDRALLLGLPPLAVLAAFALPTLRRSVSAAIDWFSVCFFTCCALGIWLIYVAMQTGVPAKPAANVAKLAPGFEASFNPLSLLFALIATATWIALVAWRTGRHRPALWTRLVLPAGGVALCWLLLMSLWLPLLDYARSYQPLFARLKQVIPAQACVRAPDLERTQLAAIKVYTGWQIDTRTDASRGVSASSEPTCEWRLELRREHRRNPAPTTVIAPDGWRFVVRLQRPADRVETWYVYRKN